MRDELLTAFHRRHASHSFTDCPIAEADLDYVLEAGRLSPSAFGLEPWHFVVCRGPADKSALQAACFGQPQVGEAAAVIVILARASDLAPDQAYTLKLLEREYPGERLAAGLAMYRDFYASVDVTAWSITQCHIAAANMMTAAAVIGLDSCPIGGYLPDAVTAAISADPTRFRPALVLALGYSNEAVPTKQRLDMDTIVTRR